MKKLLATVMLIFFTLSVANAETLIDFEGTTTDALHDLRLQINKELARRNELSVISEDRMKLSEIFPDKEFAKIVRDEIGAISIEDVVTQDDLNEVERIWFGSAVGDTNDVQSLSGIHHLQNLECLHVSRQEGLTRLPEEIGRLEYLTDLAITSCSLSVVPSEICDIMGLEALDISYNPITDLPKDIGNLQDLKTLNISNTMITSLPKSIYALELENFYRRGTTLE